MVFKDQPEAVTALLAGKVDAFAGTALGSRVLANANQELEAVAHDMGNARSAPVGAFSLSKNNLGLLQAVNEQLRHYIGSADHRARMAKYGFTRTQIDGVVTAPTLKS